MDPHVGSKVVRQRRKRAGPRDGRVHLVLAPGRRLRPRAARVPGGRRQGRLGRLGGHPAGLRVGAGHRRRASTRPRASSSSSRRSSLASEYCAEELGRAQKGGKRIVPIACEAVDPARRRQGLRQLNWIWCREGDDRDAAFAQALELRSTPTSSGRGRTRGCSCARSSGTRGRTAACSCAGATSRQAERELAANAANEPTPTELQQRYVRASRSAASRRQRRLLGGVLLALAVSVALGSSRCPRSATRHARNATTRPRSLSQQPRTTGFPTTSTCRCS